MKISTLLWDKESSEYVECEVRQIAEFVIYMQTHWIEWLFSVTGVIFGYIVRKLKQQQKENQAIADGVRSLLRDSIVENYNKYQDKGYCPIYAKESIKHVYKAYHNLGGNDVATKLYRTLLKMKEE